MQNSKLKTQNHILKLKIKSPVAKRHHSFAFGLLRFEFNNKGFGLMEIIIVSAIILTALVGFLQAETSSLRLLRTEKDSLEASFLAQEGLEAARALRDENWSSVASTTNGAVYSPVLAGAKWSLSAGSSTVGAYTRTLVFDQVLRNAQDEISSSGTLDYGTRKVVSIVSWASPLGSRQVQLAAYLTNFQSFLLRQAEAKKVYYEGQGTDADLISFPYNSGYGDPAQSFTPPSYLKVTKAEIYIRRASTNPSSIYAEIRTAATTTPLAVSNIVNSSTLPENFSWVEFRFPKPVALQGSTQYYLRLRSTPESTIPWSGASGIVVWGYGQSGGSGPYSGGYGYRYIGAQGNPSDPGQILTQFDFNFRIYGLQ